MNQLIDFLFPSRLHRLGYFLRVILTNAVIYFLYANSTTMDSRYWWAAFIAVWTNAVFFVIRPRLRDMGMNGWCLLVCFIPVADIILGLILLFRAPVMRPNQESGT